MFGHVIIDIFGGIKEDEVEVMKKNLRVKTEMKKRTQEKYLPIREKRKEFLKTKYSKYSCLAVDKVFCAPSRVI